MNTYRVLGGASGAFWAAIAGVVAAVAIGLFLWLGQPFGTINDVALVVMTLSLGPVMLAHYELGGVVPLLPARLSLGAGVAAAAGWSLLQLAMVLGLVTFDYAVAATGAFALSCLLQIVVGLWIGGASLLAGRWLPIGVRALGIVAGAGTALTAAGLLLGGTAHPLSAIGGVGYVLVLPVWAYLLGRVFAAKAHAGGGGPVGSAVPASR